MPAFKAFGFGFIVDESWRPTREHFGALASIYGTVVTSFIAMVIAVPVGIGVAIPWWDYALTQFPALAHYLRLTFWPRPLVFDYGTFWIGRLAEVWLQACVVVALIAGALFAWWRKPAVGLLGTWFFAILAPTSGS